MPAACSAPRGELSATYAVTGEQVREWAFLSWCALIDTGKHLRRHSLREARSRLHQARHHIWALWAAAHGALYPIHGLSQVLDHAPENLPPGLESTRPRPRQPARAARGPAPEYSPRSARPPPGGTQPTPPAAMAAYVTRALFANPDREPSKIHRLTGKQKAASSNQHT